MLFLVGTLLLVVTAGGIGHAYLVLLAVSIGYIALLVAAIITGAKRATRVASLAGVFASIPIAVAGYLIVMTLFARLSGSGA
jgi:hypothetical protein